MRTLRLLNDAWMFHRAVAPALLAEPHPGESVHLPHNAVDLPYNYFDETCYQRAFAYQRVLTWQPEFAGREVALVFDGAMADAKVYLNGEEIAAHSDGYTPFEARLTDRLRQGDNLVTVTIDGSENPAIPPFGWQIDYLTYAGIYRDVWLRLTAPVSVKRVKIETQATLDAAKGVTVRCDIANPRGYPLSGGAVVTLRDAAGREIATATTALDADSVSVAFSGLTGLSLWQLDDPVLYTATVVLEHPAGGDTFVSTFGFRTAEFTPDGFLLNGQPLKLRGLNRHQSFLYVGYAMGRRAQERDAEILKRELKLNIVRTSHYPQSPYFLDACDRLGLLVFEEIPGWQHVGDTAWQAAAAENVRAMLERDWNHPSIILWGVRINESGDHHDFYAETNRLAHALDPTRQTGGVRCIAHSEMLEDVYTMNDFILGDEERPQSQRPRTPLRDQREVTGLAHHVPYMVTEFNGHMHPTKRYDQEQRQAAHVTRYLDILNAAYGDPSIAGSIGWCMADYNTHKDFGSGDRICHHGVTDMFREPKFAAYVYISQCDPSDEVVMRPVTVHARGDRNIGGNLPLIVLTNCDEVEFRYGPRLVKRVKPDRDSYPHLPHAPVIIDQRVLTEEEMGCWGMAWENASLTGFIAGKAVAHMDLVADPVPTTLQVAADTLVLADTAKDATRVIVRALDQVGNPLAYLDDPVSIAVTGPAKLLGPALTTLRGGTAGFWIETTGGAGPITLTVATPRLGETRLTLNATPAGRTA